MRRRLLIALVIALLAVPVCGDYPLLLFGSAPASSTPPFASTNWESISTNWDSIMDNWN